VPYIDDVLDNLATGINAYITPYQPNSVAFPNAAPTAGFISATTVAVGHPIQVKVTTRLENKQVQVVVYDSAPERQEPFIDDVSWVYVVPTASFTVNAPATLGDAITVTLTPPSGSPVVVTYTVQALDLIGNTAAQTANICANLVAAINASAAVVGGTAFVQPIAVPVNGFNGNISLYGTQASYSVSPQTFQAGLYIQAAVSPSGVGHATVTPTAQTAWTLTWYRQTFRSQKKIVIECWCFSRAQRRALQNLIRTMLGDYYRQTEYDGTTTFFWFGALIPFEDEQNDSIYVARIEYMADFTLTKATQTALITSTTINTQIDTSYTELPTNWT
jgi:hypothetical protein